MIGYDSAVRLLVAATAGASAADRRLVEDVVASVVDLGLSTDDWARLAGTLEVMEPRAPWVEMRVGARIVHERPFSDTCERLRGEIDDDVDPGVDRFAPLLLGDAGSTATDPGAAWLLALSSDDLARGFAAALTRSAGADRLRLAVLLRQVTTSRRDTGAPPLPAPTWSAPPQSAPPQSAVPESPDFGFDDPPAPPAPPQPPSQTPVVRPGPPPHAAPPPATPTRPRRRRLLRGRRHGYGADAAPTAVGADPPPTAADGGTDLGTVAPATGRDAYPLIGCPPVWVSETPVEVEVGLSDKQLSALITTPGPVVDVAQPVDDLEVILLVDPNSLVLAAGQPHRIPLPVTAAVPFPTVTVTMTARADVTLATDRRIGVHFVRGGRSVGFAWRTIRVVDSADLAGVPQPPSAPGVLVDLSPLLADDPPELVVTITKGDSAREPTYVWSAYTTLPDVVVADLPFSSAVESGEASKFATEQRRAIASTTKGLPLFDYLVGRGVQIGRAVPAGIADALRVVASRAGERAPGVLLLTEEPFVPWELAVLDGDPAPAFGAESRFLGAHVAVSRWPLSVGPPRTSPSAAHAATRLGILTAAYDDVRNWPKLPHAEAEAAELATDYGPSTTIAPVWDDVRRCLRGEPPVDVLHVALHGQFDADGAMDGIVLLQPDGKGNLQQQFLTTNQIAGWDLVTRPFVFLNACQVAAGNTVLGSYSGMAATLVRQGATGAVAPLWNVDDDVAAGVTRTFYADVYGTESISVAEALRRIRAGYTEAAVEADPAAVTPTLIAYQFFGHPKLALQREAVS